MPDLVSIPVRFHILAVQHLRFITPAAPTLVSEPPTGENWIHEVKFDGWRCQIIKDDRGIRLYSRQGADWTGRLPRILEAVGSIKPDSFIIDGELVGVANGDFYDIPTAIKRQQVCVVAFDLMHLDGIDTRLRPLNERRHLLQGILAPGMPIIFSETFPDGTVLLREVEARGLEGIVSKRVDLKYQVGASIGGRRSLPHGSRRTRTGSRRWADR